MFSTVESQVEAAGQGSPHDRANAGNSWLPLQGLHGVNRGSRLLAALGGCGVGFFIF